MSQNRTHLAPRTRALAFLLFWLLNWLLQRGCSWPGALPRSFRFTAKLLLQQLCASQVV